MIIALWSERIQVSIVLVVYTKSWYRLCDSLSYSPRVFVVMIAYYNRLPVDQHVPATLWYPLLPRSDGRTLCDDLLPWACLWCGFPSLWQTGGPANRRAAPQGREALKEHKLTDCKAEAKVVMQNKTIVFIVHYLGICKCVPFSTEQSLWRSKSGSTGVWACME